MRGSTSFTNSQTRSAVATTDGTAPSSTFRSLLADETTFVRIADLVTTRGPLADSNAARLVALAEELSRLGAVHALSITDNPGGHPRIAPEALGSMLKERGQEVIIHLTCKDRNRNGLESRAWTLASTGFENLLCLSGDHPVAGYEGQAEPVFDIDSVALLQMLGQMNRGLPLPGSRPGRRSTLPPTQLLLAAVVYPYSGGAPGVAVSPPPGLQVQSRRPRPRVREWVRSGAARPAQAPAIYLSPADRRDAVGEVGMVHGHDPADARPLAHFQIIRVTQ